MDLLDKIYRKLQDKSRKSGAMFVKLANQIADGTEPPLETVADTLSESGKTMDDLRQKVTEIRKRRDLRAKLDMLKELEEERSQLVSKMDKANQELEAAEKRHNDVAWPIQIRIDEIIAAIATANEARRQLFASCSDAELTSQLEEATRESEKCVDRQTQVRDEIHRLTQELDAPHGLRFMAKYNRGGMTANDVERVEGLLRHAQQQLAALQAQAAELKCKRERLEGMMIDD